MSRLWLLAAIAAPAAADTVRIGALYPRRRTSGLPYTSRSRRMAAFVMAVEEINNRTDLLPHTNLSFAVKDSKCSKGYALVGAHELVSEAFGGAGVSALVGAACSSASASAASYANLYSVPQVSPSSTSATLSDSVTYPYFARVAPSDALQSFALADLVEHQLGVSRVACVHSDDVYGAAGMASFITEARLRRIDRLAVTSFANGATEFATQIEALRRSAAQVIVLFCQSTEAADFLAAVQAAGVLENVTWVGSEAATAAVSTNAHLQPGVMGYLGLRPPVGEGDVYTQFLSRLDAFQAGVVGDWGCSNATDDDGNRLWRQEDADGGDCIWPGAAATSDFYASFSYDAVYTIARALDGLVDGNTDGGVDGDALHAAILATSFTGTTGEVGFDATGDRNRGIRYDVFSVSAGAGFFELGTWVEGSTWADRFTQAANASYVSVYGTSTVDDLASSSEVLKLGVMCHTVHVGGSTTMLEECDQILHAVDVINNKADGVFDGLLANRTIVTAVREVGCVEGRAQQGWLALQQSSPGGFDFGAVIGPTCSDDVTNLGSASWRAAAGRAVVISHSSTAEKIGGAAGEAAYANVARTVTHDGNRAVGISKLCADVLSWKRLAVLHDDSVWAAGGAEGFRRTYEAGGGEVLRGLDGGHTVGFELAAFDSGAVSMASIVARLEAVQPRVTVVITQPRVQRAFFAHLHDHDVLYGHGYGYVTLWMSQDVFLNNASSVNMSAVHGSWGVLALTPSALVGLPRVVEPIVERWRVAARPACDGLAYCDADGDPTSWSEYSASAVDAVLLYAHAADAVLRNGGDAHDPDALYRTMLSMPPFEGVAGRVVLDEYGDRLGSLQLYNLQIRSGLGGGGGGRRRRLSTSIGLDMSAAFVEVGSYDSLTRDLTVDLPSIVFSKGTTQVPITETPCELHPQVAAEYYAYTVSGCDWYNKPLFGFYWETTPLGACTLPANTTAKDACYFSFPRRLRVVQACIWIPASPALLLLMYPVAALGLHLARFIVDRLNRHRDGGGDSIQRGLPSALNMAAAMPSPRMACMYGLVWLGAAAHAVATPLAFSDDEPGYADDSSCVAREAVGVLAPALVVVGVTARVGQVLSGRFTARSGEDAVMRTQTHYGALYINVLFFLILCTVVAGLGWALDRERRRIEGPAAELFNFTVDVALDMGSAATSTTTNVDVEYSRCRRLSDYDDSTYWALVLPVHFMCAMGVALHAVRMLELVRGHQSYIIFGEGMLLTMLTLFLNLFVSLFLTNTSDANRGDFRVRAGFGCAVGWITLLIEGWAPEFRRYALRQEERELLLHELDQSNLGKRLELDPPLRIDRTGVNRRKASSAVNLEAALPPEGSHVFLSHNWSRGQDQVHSLVPMLRLMVPEPRGIKLWLDDEQLTDGISKEHLEAAVRASDAILVFLTEKYVSSEFCRAELTAATQSNVRVIVVQEASQDHGGMTPEELKAEINEAIKKADIKGEPLSEPTKNALKALLEEVQAQFNGERTPLFWYRTHLFKRAVLRHVVQQLVAWQRQVKKRRGQDKRYDDKAHHKGTVPMSRRASHDTQRDEGVTQRSGEVESAGTMARLSSSSRVSEREGDGGVPQDSSTQKGVAPQLVFLDESRPPPLLAEKPGKHDIFLYLSPEYPEKMRKALEKAFEEAAKTLSDRARGSGARGSVVVRFNGPNQRFAAFKGSLKDPKKEVTPVLCLHDDVGEKEETGASDSTTTLADAALAATALAAGPGKPFFDSDDLIGVTKTVFEDLMKDQKKGNEKRESFAAPPLFAAPPFTLLSQSAQRGSIRDEEQARVSGRTRQAVSVDAVLFYSTKEAISYYIEAARSLDKKDDESKELRESLFKPLWRMWPHDKTLQTVVAEAELVKLLDAKAKKSLPGVIGSAADGALHKTRRVSLSVAHAVERLRPGHGSVSPKQVVPHPTDDAQSK